MSTNLIIYLLTGLIPLAVGAIYYNPKVFGNYWMKANGMDGEMPGGGHHWSVYAISYVLSVMFSVILASLVIHQTDLISIGVAGLGEMSSEAIAKINADLAHYEGVNRTFSHGAFHGIILSIFLALPMIAINALFEKRGWSYILIHFGYWALCIILMGGVLCQYVEVAPIPAG